MPTNVAGVHSECLANNETGFRATSGAEFDVFCGINFIGLDFYLSYPSDFYSCINSCADWNTNSTNAETCVGVSWNGGVYGPEGQAGGSQCFFKFSMPGIGIQDPVPDSARLKQVLNSTVPMFLNSADILGAERINHNHIFRSHLEFEFYSHIDHYECRTKVGAFECSHWRNCRWCYWWHGFLRHCDPH